MVTVSRRFYIRKHSQHLPKFDPNQVRKSGQIHGNPWKSMEIMLVFRTVPYVKSVKRAFLRTPLSRVCVVGDQWACGSSPRFQSNG